MNEINSDLSSSNLVILKNKNFSQNYSLLSPHKSDTNIY